MVAPVLPVPTSSTPKVTIQPPRVTTMSPLSEPARTHPRVMSPAVVHTIPPYPVTPPRLERGPPPKLLPPRNYNTWKCRKQAPAKFMAAITDEPILNPVNPQVENYVINSETRVAKEYKHLIKGPDKYTRKTSFTNELGRLTKGVGDRLPTGTEKNVLIQRSLLHKDRTFTHGQIVVEISPTKTETHHTCLTVGENTINYPGDVSTPTPELNTFKLLLNSTISTPREHFMMGDVIFFFSTPYSRTMNT